MSIHETKIGFVVMEWDKKPASYQTYFRVVVNKMQRAINSFTKKHPRATPQDLALVAAYTLLPKGTGHTKEVQNGRSKTGRTK